MQRLSDVMSNVNLTLHRRLVLLGSFMRSLRQFPQDVQKSLFLIPSYNH